MLETVDSWNLSDWEDSRGLLRSCDRDVPREWKHANCNTDVHCYVRKCLGKVRVWSPERFLSNWYKAQRRGIIKGAVRLINGAMRDTLTSDANGFFFFFFWSIFTQKLAYLVVNSILRPICDLTIIPDWILLTNSSIESVRFSLILNLKRIFVIFLRYRRFYLKKIKDRKKQVKRVNIRIHISIITIKVTVRCWSYNVNTSIFFLIWIIISV